MNPSQETPDLLKRIKELEQENKRLKEENVKLKIQMSRSTPSKRASTKES